MSIENIKVPDLGDASEVEVIELLVSVGQSVEENDSLLVLESDKAAMEIPAPMAGVVKSISVNLGDKVSAGSEILTLEIDAEGSKQDSSEEGSGATAEAGAKQEKEEKKTEYSKSAAEGKPEKTEKPEKPEKTEKTAASPTSQTIEVPDLGTDEEIEVIEVHIKVKDSVEVYDVLITLESYKAAMDVPAPYAGVIESLLVAVGDKVKTG